VYIRRRSRYPITLIIMKDVDAHLWTERMAMRFKKRGFPQLPRKKVANRSTARMIIESHDYRIGMESRILFYVFMLTARPRASFACNSRPHLRQRAAIAAFSDWLYWRLPFILFSALFVSQFARHVVMLIERISRAIIATNSRDIYAPRISRNSQRAMRSCGYESACVSIY